jgi:hypothetical protein
MVAMNALTSFVDGTFPHQADLNNYGSNIDALCQLTTGKTAASGVSSKPLCRVSLNANQSIPDSTITVVSWNAAGANTDNMWVASQPTQLTVQTAGWYAILLQDSWTGATQSNRSCGIMINGTSEATNGVAKNWFAGSLNGPWYHQVVAYEHLAAGATIYGYVYQVSGGALNLVTSVPGTYLSARWDAPY